MLVGDDELGVGVVEVAAELDVVVDVLPGSEV